MKCLHECCVCARLFILKCSCVKKKKRKAIESKCLMGKYSYFLYVGCKACIRLYVSGSHLFFSLLSSVCSWQQSIFLPIWCCCTSLEKSTKLHPSIYLCLAFRVFLYRRVHCSRKRGMVSTASSTFHYAPPPHVPYLCACCVTLWQKHSNSDQHFCCTYCEWLLSLASGSIPQQLDRIVDLIATAVREVLPRDVITHKHSPVMPEWFNNFHNLFCNIFNTGVIFCT